MQPDIDQIAGAGDVIGGVCLHVGNDAVQHGHVVDTVTATAPVHVARQTLAGELAQPRLRNGAKMGIGQMGEAKHAGHLPRRRAVRQALPMRIPVRNTSTPPSTTWKAACRNGVSMYLARIQAMAQSSTSTTTQAIEVATQNALGTLSGTR